MEDPKHKKKLIERGDFAFGISFSEFVISMATGVVSGLFTAGKTIRDLFHEDAKSATDFKQHFASRQKRLDDIELKNFKTPMEYWNASRAEKKVLTQEYNEIAKNSRAVRSGIIGGTLDRYHTLSARSRGGLYFNGAVGAAIGAAMTLSFFNGVATRDKIEKIADKVGADNEISR